MRVVVTGAAGFIGAAVTHLLVGRGDTVVAVLQESTSVERLADLQGSLRLVKSGAGAARATADAIAGFRPDAVLHLAWYARPGVYLEAQENLQSLAATASFLENVFATGCRQVVASGTCLEYEQSEAPHLESDPVNPQSLYASSKLAAFFVGRALARRFGSRFAWARLFHVLGPGENNGRLLPTVARALLSGRPLAVSSGSQVRDHLHVADVAAALVCLMDSRASDVYNVCSGLPVPLREVLSTAAEVLGRGGLLQFGGRLDPPDETPFLVGCPDRIRQLGWRPRMNLREGLEDALSGYAAEADHTGKIHS